MSMKEVAWQQYIRIVDRAIGQINSLKTPPEGWLTTMCKEREGDVTLRLPTPGIQYLKG